MVKLTQEQINRLDTAAKSFDGHVTNGSSGAVVKTVEALLAEILQELGVK